MLEVELSAIHELQINKYLSKSERMQPDLHPFRLVVWKNNSFSAVSPHDNLWKAIIKALIVLPSAIYNVWWVWILWSIDTCTCVTF